MKKILFFLLLPLAVFCQPSSTEKDRWKKQAARVTIFRDNWGVPHVYGKSDADAVFGLMYAQCEDNFWQLEETTVRLLGRAAEIHGEKELESDAAVALFGCVQKGKQTFATAGPELKRLCTAAADAVNFYLETHPTTEVRLLRRYEPWFFLISQPLNPADHGISRNETRQALGRMAAGSSEGTGVFQQSRESGSNTIALAPRKTTTGNSMLLINPHVGFFGNGQRYEAHLVSKEGLNASGFAMFGQFHIWSGFNENLGWAHTNTASDYQDVYLESFDHATDSLMYRYGGTYRKAEFWRDTLLYKTPAGMQKKIYAFRRTHHGPVVARRDSFLVTVRGASDQPGDYIMQSWNMSKARNLAAFRAAMAKVQLSTNTMYADRAGNIVYWHGNAIPRRDTSFNYTFPVDGSNPKTDWKGKHALGEIVQVVNPASGWIQNCNSTPFAAAGNSSPAKKKYPSYMANDPVTARSIEALRLLTSSGRLSAGSFRELVMSNHLPLMAAWIPQLVAAYDRQEVLAPRPALKAIVDTLRNWNHRASVDSRATTIASFWAAAYFNWAKAQVSEQLPVFSPDVNYFYESPKLPAPDTTALSLLEQTAALLQKRFGTTMIPWGEVNRLQRIHTSGTLEKFDDNKPSVPVAGAQGILGSLFAFSTRTEPGGVKQYGVGGNTYVAIVEFGKKVKAKSIVYFGQSADPSSPHYFDQAPLYAKGALKDAWFYEEDVKKHATRTYRPGE